MCISAVVTYLKRKGLHFVSVCGGVLHVSSMNISSCEKVILLPSQRTRIGLCHSSIWPWRHRRPYDFQTDTGLFRCAGQSVLDALWVGGVCWMQCGWVCCGWTLYTWAECGCGRTRMLELRVWQKRCFLSWCSLLWFPLRHNALP